MAVSLAAHLILWIGWRWFGNGPGPIGAERDEIPTVEMVAMEEDFIPVQPAPPVLISRVETPIPKLEREPVVSAPAPSSEFTPPIPPRSPPLLTPVTIEPPALKPSANTVPDNPITLPEPGHLASPALAPRPVPPVVASGSGQAVPSTAATSTTNLPPVRPGGIEPPLFPGPVRYRQAKEPDYPATARRRRQEGVVLLEALLTPDGRVRSVELQRSSGFPLLDQAALKAVAGWEFVVPTGPSWRVEVPVRFQLTR